MRYQNNRGVAQKKSFGPQLIKGDLIIARCRRFHWLGNYQWVTFNRRKEPERRSRRKKKGEQEERRLVERRKKERRDPVYKSMEYITFNKELTQKIIPTKNLCDFTRIFGERRKAALEGVERRKTERQNDVAR